MKTFEFPECSACGNPVNTCTCGKARVVVCAANRSTVTGKIICGARHWDHIMRQQVEWLKDHPTGLKMPDEWVGCDQGFIDQYGQWMNRQEAWMVAKAAGQIKQTTGASGTLYSEDLY